MPSDMAFRSHFGTWGKALTESGFVATKFIPVGARKGVRNRKRKIVDAMGYDVVFEPNHPISMKNGYVRIHRKIMYDCGFLKNVNDIVHHKNENKKDNRLCNLEVVSNSNHTFHHVNDKSRPRNNSKVCSGENCKSITASKYGLCRFHYKQRWQKLSNLSKSKIIGSIHEHQHPELLGIKNV